MDTRFVHNILAQTAVQLGIAYDSADPQGFLTALREASAAEGGGAEWSGLINTIEGLLAIPSASADPENALFAIDSPFALIRAAAARALGESGDSRMVHPLTRALQGNTEAETPSLDSDIPDHLDRVAGNLARDQAAISMAQLGEPALQPLLDALSDPNPQTRASAARGLAMLGDSRALQPLVGLLSDGSANVRLSTLFALNNMPGESVIEALRPLQNDPDQLVRDLANSLLKRLDPDLAFDDLLKSTRSRHTNVQRTSILSLGSTRDRRALEPLVELLQSSNEQGRYSAAEALGDLGYPEAIDPLKAALHGSSPYMRARIIEALQKLGYAPSPEEGTYEQSPSALAADIDPELQQQLALLTDPRWRTRLHAAEAIGNLADVAAAPGLIQALERTDEVQPVFDAVVSALVRLGADAAQPLLEALHHPTRSVRLGAVQALSSIANDHAAIRLTVLDALLEVAGSDAEPWVRKAAMPALSKHKHPALLPVLVEAARDKSYQVRWGAVIALGDLGNPDALDPLIDALKDRNRDVRRSAATSLAKLRDPRSVEALSEALLDDWHRVGESAATALRKLKAKPQIQPFVNGLASKDAGVRARAAALLGEHGSRSAVQALISALGDKEGRVRSAAARALGNLNDPAAVEPLVKALSTYDEIGDFDLPVQVASALGKLRHPGAVEGLVGMLVHERPDVRYAAILSLQEIADPRAIEPLQRVQNTDKASTMIVGGYGAVRLADAARTAIEHIEARSNR